MAATAAAITTTTVLLCHAHPRALLRREVVQLAETFPPLAFRNATTVVNGAPAPAAPAGRAAPAARIFHHPRPDNQIVAGNSRPEIVLKVVSPLPLPDLL